jgi:hypothetical protein
VTNEQPRSEETTELESWSGARLNKPQAWGDDRFRLMDSDGGP